MPTPEDILKDIPDQACWVSFPKGACLEADHTDAEAGILGCVSPGLYRLLVDSKVSTASDMGHIIMINNPKLFNTEALSKLEPLKSILD